MSISLIPWVDEFGRGRGQEEGERDPEEESDLVRLKSAYPSFKSG